MLVRPDGVVRGPSPRTLRNARLSPAHTTHLRVLVAGEGLDRVARRLRSSRACVEELAEYGATTPANRDRIAAALDEIARAVAS